MNRQDKLARFFLPKNILVMVLACFFGCLFIISSIYVLVSDNLLYGTDSHNVDLKERNIQICEQLAADYYRSHTYNENDIYDCDNMAQDVWNMLKAKGINARIAAGDFKPGRVSRIEDNRSVRTAVESGSSGSINTYNYTCEETGLLNSTMIDNLTHAWVLAEVSPGNWLAVECTGGYVVHSEEDAKYYSGLTFSNPRNYRNFLELYSNWKKQTNDYESELSSYNEIRINYDSVNHSDQVAMENSIEAEEDRLREKKEVFLRTDSEIQALLHYG